MTRRFTLRTTLAAGVAALALGIAAIPALDLHAQPAPTVAAAASQRLGTPVSYADLAEQVGPAVVSVAVVARAREAEAGLPGIDPESLPPRLRRFFEQQMPRADRGPRAEREAPRRMGMGSGFIVDADGTIVTNNHVVGEAAEVRVKLTDGREFTARVLGTDPRTDIAVLKVDAPSPLPFVRFAEGAVRVGEPVMAMGNPFGLGGTVTAGIVSARGRDIGAGPADDFLQHDAAINPGNSGGPLFNLAGEVAGINTAIYSPSGGNVGIGFAIPAALAQKVVSELREHGTVARGFVGVVLAPLEPTMAAALGRTDAKGAVVREVAADSPAARAGIRVGDVVVAIDGRPVDAPRDVVRAAGAATPGERLGFTVLRRDGTHEVAVTLAAAPAQRAADQGGARKGEPQRRG